MRTLMVMPSGATVEVTAGVMAGVTEGVTVKA